MDTLRTFGLHAIALKDELRIREKMSVMRANAAALKALVPVCAGRNSSC